MSSSGITSTAPTATASGRSSGWMIGYAADEQSNLGTLQHDVREERGFPSLVTGKAIEIRRQGAESRRRPSDAGGMSHIQRGSLGRRYLLASILWPIHYDVTPGSLWESAEPRLYSSGSGKPSWMRRSRAEVLTVAMRSSTSTRRQYRDSSSNISAGE